MTCHAQQQVEQAMLEDQLVAMLRMEGAYVTEAAAPCRCPNNKLARGALNEWESSPKGCDEMGAATDANAPLPHDEWRRKICEWSYKVVDHFKFDREVVSVAMNYFDRFLANSSHERQAEMTLTGSSECACPSCLRSVDSKTFQLAAMTALYVAIKLHAASGVDDAQGSPSCSPCYGSDDSLGSASTSSDSDTSDSSRSRRKRKKLKLLSFVELSRGQFSSEDICAMERRMLHSLRWKVNPPSPMALVTNLLRLFPSRASLSSSMPCARHYDLVLHVLHELSRYLTELSVCLTDVSSAYAPSHIAYSSILISMDMLTKEALPPSIRAAFYDSVSRVSVQASGMVLVPEVKSVTFLRHKIRSSFLPEMLLDNSGFEDKTSSQHKHPISLARDAGLLDATRLYSQRPNSLKGRSRSVTCVTQGTKEYDRSMLGKVQRRRTCSASPRRLQGFSSQETSPTSVTWSKSIYEASS